MSQNKQKIVQAFIEAVNEIADIVEEANALAQDYKTKWIALNPDLTDTNLSTAQVTAVNAWITSLNNVATDQVVSIARDKLVKSHGTKALG